VRGRRTVSRCREAVPPGGQGGAAPAREPAERALRSPLITNSGTRRAAMRLPAVVGCQGMLEGEQREELRLREVVLREPARGGRQRRPANRQRLAGDADGRLRHGAGSSWGIGHLHELPRSAAAPPRHQGASQQRMPDGVGALTSPRLRRIPLVPTSPDVHPRPNAIGMVDSAAIALTGPPGTGRNLESARKGGENHDVRTAA
jgi:hypothetical protein